jgi:SAM-dependent methyltransferase
MFLRKSFERELMDDISINDERIDIALKELQIINKYLGGKSVTRKGLKKLHARIASKNKIKILDVGGGASDTLLSLNNTSYKIFSVDLNKRVTKYLKKNSNGVEIVCGDAFNLPFKFRFDVSHLSLFLHHFNEEEIKNILSGLSEISKYGVIINDLHRSILAYLGIKILTMLFSKSELVKNDGPLSVKRGFVKNELIKILDDLNFEYELSYNWAFRWLAVIYLRNEK